MLIGQRESKSDPRVGAIPVETGRSGKEMQSESEIRSAVQRDIERLFALQNREGGFAFCK